MYLKVGGGQVLECRGLVVNRAGPGWRVLSTPHAGSGVLVWCGVWWGGVWWGGVGVREAGGGQGDGRGLRV